MQERVLRNDDFFDPCGEGSAAKALSSGGRKRVVIVWGGFAGIAAARALRRSDADIILIDKRNHHVIQPPLY